MTKYMLNSRICLLLLEAAIPKAVPQGKNRESGGTGRKGGEKNYSWAQERVNSLLLPERRHLLRQSYSDTSELGPSKR